MGVARSHAKRDAFFVDEARVRTQRKRQCRPCSSSPRRCLAWQHRTPAGYAVTSPHPDQGLITALPMEVTAVVTAVSSESRALVAMTNWRGLRQKAHKSGLSLVQMSGSKWRSK